MRVLCITAFDAVYTRHHGRPLSPARARTLAALLDLGASANAILDRKRSCRHERHNTLDVLRQAGIGLAVAQYLRRLRYLERSRPTPQGDRARFQDVQLYREAVVRLSLGMLSAAAEPGRSIDEGIRATHPEGELSPLFRMAMQCQIIDDVLDRSSDIALGLPTLLTACASPVQSFELARQAAHEYADLRRWRVQSTALCTALFLVSSGATLAIAAGRWRQGARGWFTRSVHSAG